MSQKIQLLDDNLINKIAAGEVIESPSSVVKELVENAIDANAKNIVIEVKKSGLDLIRVEDDGIGMNKKDAYLCFQRHATSKIKTFDDLTFVNSMGFRGEALASIAAISKIEIKTSVGDIATHLKIDFSKKIFEKEIARTKGTTIEIKSLFFNVPVRKKFQKNLSTIASEIIRVITNLSFCKADIGFRLIINGKTKISTKPQYVDKKIALKNRIKDLLSKEFVKNSIEIDFKQNDIEIFGLISDPNFCKKTRLYQYLIVNNRSVYCSMISKFVKEAFGTRISETDFPAFALHIKISFEFVDVNIHPQKKEIKFKENIFIKETIKKAINLAFENNIQKNDENENFNFFSSDFSFTKPEIKNKNTQIFEEKKENIFFKKFEKQLIFEKICDIENFNLQFLKIDNFVLLDAKYLKNFIDIKDDEKIIIFNLSAIFSSFFFETVKNKKNILKSQSLLIPINIDLNIEDIAFIEENILSFSKLGFDIRVVSKDQIAIDATYRVFQKEDIKKLFFLILEELKRYNKSDMIDKVYEKKLAIDISKIAKMKTYSNEEAINLLHLFVKNKMSFIDPLGMKIFKTLSKNSIEKFFKKS